MALQRFFIRQENMKIYLFTKKPSFLDGFCRLSVDLRFGLRSIYFKSNGGYFLKIFYLDDENGTFLSTDGRRRFCRLVGGEVLSYIKENRFQKVYFFTTSTEEELGDLVLIEIPEASVSKFRKEMNHKNYLRQIEKDSLIMCISLFDQAEGEEGLTVQDTIVDEAIDVEEKVILEIQLEMLRRALKVLSDEDLRIIHSLYLSEDPLSETQLSEILGIPRTTLMSHRDQIFSRIRRLFKMF